MSDRFAGRRALVTGASRGIGAAVAERLAAEGADVAIVARTLEAHDHLAGSLRDTAARIQAYGRVPTVVVADMASPADRERVVPEAEAGLGGPVEILVNNAAAAMYAPVATMPSKRRRILFEVNALAPLDLAQAVIPGMTEGGEGWVVNLTSATARPAARSRRVWTPSALGRRCRAPVARPATRRPGCLAAPATVVTRMKKRECDLTYV